MFKVPFRSTRAAFEPALPVSEWLLLGFLRKVADVRITRTGRRTPQGAEIYAHLFLESGYFEVFVVFVMYLVIFREVVAKKNY